MIRLLQIILCNSYLMCPTNLRSVGPMLVAPVPKLGKTAIFFQSKVLRKSVDASSYE